MDRGERKAMLGHKVRRLRREHGLTQALMAEQLGISPSYLNLIEHNQRPLTVPLLLKLGQGFGVDLQTFAEDEEMRLLAGLREVFADPLLAGGEVRDVDLRELAASSPAVGQALLTLYRGYRETREDIEALTERMADGDKLAAAQPPSFPLDAVRDFLQANANHFPALETAADELWQGLDGDGSDLVRTLSLHLERVHGVRIKVMPADVMGQSLRRFDRHSRRILLSEMLPASGRSFQLAHQTALLQHRELIDRLIAEGGVADEETRRIARIALANYYAGAVLMPYDRFLEAARAVRYDVEVLERRFDVSFEQACHRLTTLQRSGSKGVPFFLIRIDNAGNVSKRFSATSLHFARFGGACPRWNVHDAFRTPGMIITQLARMPDDSAYFSIARTVTKSGGSWKQPAQQFAIALGCDVAFASQLVYAEGVDLGNLEAATPIGLNCRLCPRLDCSQRAAPPVSHRLTLDENLKGPSGYAIGGD